MSAASRQHIDEERLDALRTQAREKGRVTEPGIRPAGSPLPLASPETGYYGLHLLKQPQWTPLIPLYFFVGGAAGSMGVIGSLADVIGREKQMAQAARWFAVGGAVLSSALLIIDLGRPARFINMLRVFKPQSTMSMGSWILSGFSTSAGLSSAADVLRMLGAPRILAAPAGFFGRSGTVLFAMLFHDYTGVLLATTAIPVWNSYARSLPREFGMSGLQSAVSLLELAGYSDRRALNYLGLFSAGLEWVESNKATFNRDRASRPLHHGRSGLLVLAGTVLSGPVAIGLRLASMWTGKRRARRLRQLAACAGIAGSLCMRYGWVAAGSASARDWELPMQKPAGRKSQTPI